MNTAGTNSDLLQTLGEVNFVQVGLIAAGAWLLIRLSSYFLSFLATRVSDRFRYFVLSLIPLLRLLIIIVSLVLMMVSIIEPTIKNMMVILGALGLGLGFAFKDYVSSLIAGVVTLYEAPYRPGDWIEINGAYGEVRAINMRSAEIVTPDDTVVIIPHMRIWDHLIFNANDGSQDLQCAADFYLHPLHDAREVQQRLNDAALTSPYLQLDKDISVIVSEKPWGTHYRLKAYPIEPRQQFQFVTDLTVRGKAALNRLDVKYIAVPPLSENA